MQTVEINSNRVKTSLTKICKFDSFFILLFFLEKIFPGSERHKFKSECGKYIYHVAIIDYL